MTQRLPHLYLRNPSGYSRKFDKGRGIDKKDPIEKDPEAYRLHKQRLNSSFTQLLQDKADRLRNKSIVPEHIEIVEVKFLIPFSDGINYNTRSRFISEFGLTPVMQKDFNRTVLFAIADDEKFRTFRRLLIQYITSSNQSSPKHTPYAIMTAIFDIHYHTAEDIRNHCTGDLVFELINTTTAINAIYEHQRHALVGHLDALKVSGHIDEFSFDPYDKVLQIKGAQNPVVEELSRNFDILAQAHSLRSFVVKPDRFNQAKITWDFAIRNNSNIQTVVGVIDNGIRSIDPLEDVLIGGIDITRTADASSASHRHGTVVGSLAAIGNRFFTEDTELVADAHIFSIKILEHLDGYIDVISVIEAIRQAYSIYGIRLFNLSICAQGKAYNESPSLFAYLLDKLAYELDILIFIAAGNINYDDIVEMGENPHPLHHYPYHYYSPGHDSPIHSCAFTNICIPAESMNHITVGALAENFRPDTQPHLSMDKNLPAYYSRKNHYDFTQPVNGSVLSANHGNKNLFKPDIAMPGGDLLNAASAMQVVGFGDGGNDYYAFDSGTSLAAPLAANLAAQLLNLYPHLTLQSIKALLINSAASYPSGYLDTLVAARKDEVALAEYNTTYSNLSSSNKRSVTKKVLSAHDLHRNLSGYGQPVLEKLLYSDTNAASLIVEDTIKTDHHKVIILHVPEYLLAGNGGRRLTIKATLCFKINPAWGNHVDYNPLHISFNFANSVVKDSLDELADIIADRNHEYYRNNHWTDEIRELQNKKRNGSITKEENKKLGGLKTKAKNEALGIKKELGRWSEDFFPLVNKPLSNRQQMTIQMDKQEIAKLGNQLAVVIRCAVKDEVNNDLHEWKRTIREHPFSIALHIQDHSKIQGANLYEELQTVNTIEVVPNNILPLDLDVDLDN